MNQSLKAVDLRKCFVVGTIVIFSAIMLNRSMRADRKNSDEIVSKAGKPNRRPRRRHVDEMKRKAQYNGHKVCRDGSWRPYPGNKVLSFLTSQEEARVVIENAYAALKASPLAEFFAFVPPSCYHVTICAGVVMDIRVKERHKLFKNDNLETITQKMWDKGKNVLNEWKGVELSFRVRKVILGDRVLNVLLDPIEGSANDCKEKLLKKWRLSKKYRYKYGYQMTMGYLYRQLPNDLRDSMKRDLEGLLDIGMILKFGPPTLCTHSTMDQLKPFKGNDAERIDR